MEILDDQRSTGQTSFDINEDSISKDKEINEFNETKKIFKSKDDTITFNSFNSQRFFIISTNNKNEKNDKFLGKKQKPIFNIKYEELKQEPVVPISEYRKHDKGFHDNAKRKVFNTCFKIIGLVIYNLCGKLIFRGKIY